MPENPSVQPPDAGQPSGKKTPGWAWVLIGCGGVTILGFIAVIAAIVIPVRMKTRAYVRDVAVVTDLRSYAAAQAVYRQANQTFAGQMPLVSMSGRGPGLLSPALEAAHGPNGTPRMGYLFLECKTIGGKSIDWTTDYAACAVPAFYGRTGHMTLIVSTDGAVWGKDLGPGTAFVDDFPADPRAAGWVEAD